MRTVLHTESSPGLGGQELRTLSEARWIAERGWRVLLAGQPDGRFVGQAHAAGLEAVGVRMRGAWDLGAVCALRRLIRREQVSIVHTHSSVDGWVGGLAARVTGVPSCGRAMSRSAYDGTGTLSIAGSLIGSSPAERRSGAS